MKTHLKTLLTIVLLSRATLGLCQQGYTYVLDEEYLYEPSIFREVNSLILIEQAKVILGASFHWDTGHFGHLRLNSNGSIDNSFGLQTTLTGGGGKYHRMDDGYLRFYQTVTKYDLNGQGFPNFHYAYSGFPYFPADDRAVLPLPDGRFYVSGRFFVSPTENITRHLVRMMPDGSVDTTFTQRVIGSPSSAVTWDMMYYDEERIMVGGSFGTYEGYISPNMVRVFLDGSVDTTFSSPLLQRWLSRGEHVDESGRIFIINPAGGLQSHPQEDTLRIIRLLPNGLVDPTFHLSQYGGYNTPEGYLGAGIFGVVPEDDGGYIVYGLFSSVDGVPRNGMAKIDSTGHLVEDMFDSVPLFELYNDSATWALSWDVMSVQHVIRMPDGGLLAGGLFTHFNGVERWNLVKLKKVLTSVGVEETENRQRLLVFPNPTSGRLTLTNLPQGVAGHLQVFNASGQLVHHQNTPAQNGYLQIMLPQLSVGIYTLHWQSPGQNPLVQKVVVQY